jgi:hypothetical protein
MKLTGRTGRLIAAGLGTAGAVLLATTATFAATAASAAPARATAPACSSGSLALWTGSPADDAAGHSFWQVEISNVGHSTCTLLGYPGVSVLNGAGHQVGLPAGHSGHKPLVTISAGGTAHFVLTVTDALIVCAHPVHGVLLKVFAPGEFSAQRTPFSVSVCPHSVTLHVDAVHPGAGIPLHTTF